MSVRDTQDSHIIQQKAIRLHFFSRFHKEHGHIAQIFFSSSSTDKQSNRGDKQVILQGLKKRLDGAKKNWAVELHSILWVFRTSPRTPTEERPFPLAFGTEAVVPIELQISTHRVQFNDESINGEKLKSNLDALEETRMKHKYEQLLISRRQLGITTRKTDKGT